MGLPVSQVTTRKGVPVNLTYSWDIKDGINEAWVVHQLTASVGGADAGYLKVSYVPHENVPRFVPDAFAYASQVAGGNWHDREPFASCAEDRWSARQLADAIVTISPYLNGTAPVVDDHTDLGELRTIWSELRSAVERRSRSQYRQFLDYHVGKPKVDFIRVYDSGDTMKPAPDGVAHAEDSPAISARSYRRLGVGTALYEVGARWMAENGMRLYAGSAQSPSAQEAWNHLASLNLVSFGPRGPDGETSRRFIDGAAVDLPRM